jgi:hypothetical protein
MRPFPSGWRVVSIGPAEVTGPAGARPAPVAGPSTAATAQATGSARSFTAEVTVRARPPVGPASYSLPVRVDLESGPRGITVRHIDGGGSP